MIYDSDLLVTNWDNELLNPDDFRYTGWAPKNVSIKCEECGEKFTTEGCGRVLTTENTRTWYGLFGCSCILFNSITVVKTDDEEDPFVFITDPPA